MEFYMDQHLKPQIQPNSHDPPIEKHCSNLNYYLKIIKFDVVVVQTDLFKKN